MARRLRGATLGWRQLLVGISKLTVAVGIATVAGLVVVQVTSDDVPAMTYVVSVVVVVAAYITWQVMDAPPDRRSLDERHALRDQLAQRRTVGTEILGRQGATREDIEKRSQDARDWRAETADWLEANLSLADRVAFEDITGLKLIVEGKWPGFHPRMERALDELAKILERLA